MAKWRQNAEIRPALVGTAIRVPNDAIRLLHPKKLRDFFEKQPVSALLIVSPIYAKTAYPLASRVVYRPNLLFCR